MEKINFMVSGLTCSACAKIVKSHLLKKIEGVEDAEVEENGNVSLTSKNIIKKEEIENALSDTDFKLASFK